MSGALPVPKIRFKKRKTFDQLSVYGRRRGLRDIRGLFRIKEREYDVPVSRLAGFVIQQVRFLVRKILYKFYKALIHLSHPRFVIDYFISHYGAN